MTTRGYWRRLKTPYFRLIGKLRRLTWSGFRRRRSVAREAGCSLDVYCVSRCPAFRCSAVCGGASLGVSSWGASSLLGGRVWDGDGGVGEPPPVPPPVGLRRPRGCPIARGVFGAAASVCWDCEWLSREENFLDACCTWRDNSWRGGRPTRTASLRETRMLQKIE